MATHNLSFYTQMANNQRYKAKTSSKDIFGSGLKLESSSS